MAVSAVAVMDCFPCKVDQQFIPKHEEIAIHHLHGILTRPSTWFRSTMPDIAHIHGRQRTGGTAWMAGSSPAMTEFWRASR